MIKLYYNANDVQELIGCSKTLSYKIIRTLRKKFIKEYPDAITIQARIPIWYFEEKMMIKKNYEVEVKNEKA